MMRFRTLKRTCHILSLSQAADEAACGPHCFGQMLPARLSFDQSMTNLILLSTTLLADTFP